MYTKGHVSYQADLGGNYIQNKDMMAEFLPRDAMLSVVYAVVVCLSKLC